MNATRYHPTSSPAHLLSLAIVALFASACGGAPFAWSEVSITSQHYAAGSRTLAAVEHEVLARGWRVAEVDPAAGLLAATAAMDATTDASTRHRWLFEVRGDRVAVTLRVEAPTVDDVGESWKTIGESQADCHRDHIREELVDLQQAHGQSNRLALGPG